MTNMKLHPTNVQGLVPTEELGRQLMALRYDLLVPVLEGMLKEARRQEQSDEEAKRIRLSYRLGRLADGIENALETGLYEVVHQCKEYIDAEIAYMTVEFKEPIDVNRCSERIQFTHEGKDYIVMPPETGTVIGGRVDENGVATLVYR